MIFKIKSSNFKNIRQFLVYTGLISISSFAISSSGSAQKENSSILSVRYNQLVELTRMNESGEQITIDNADISSMGMVVEIQTSAGWKQSLVTHQIVLNGQLCYILDSNETICGLKENNPFFNNEN